MRKQLLKYYLLIIILRLIITGCTDNIVDMGNINNENKIESEMELADREWIIDYYDLTEEDVKDYDIDLILKHGYLKYKEKTMSRYPTKADFLESLPWLYEGAYEKEYADELKAANDYTYLLSGEDAFHDSYSDIKYLGIESIWDDRQPGETEPVGKVYALFDFENKKAYFKSHELSVLDDIRDSNDVIDLNDEDIEYIFELFSTTDFSNWERYYSAEVIYDDWKYGVETMDGKIYSNMVNNLSENAKAWKLFVELYKYTINYPIMTKTY